MLSELARAEALLAQAREELCRISTACGAKQAEVDVLAVQLNPVAGLGDADKLLTLQSRLGVLNREITHLERSQAICAAKADRANRYLIGLRTKLDQLKSEASAVGEYEPGRLSRLKLQIVAIAGDER